MNSRKVYFTNRNGYILASSLDVPEKREAEFYAMLVPCFTCTKDLKAMINISSALSDRGIAVFRFDFTGLGESEGDFTDMSYSKMLGDLQDAVDYLKDNFDLPKLLIGHSLGGCLVIEIANRIPSVKAVVTIAAPSEPSNLLDKLQSTKDAALREGFAETEIGGVRFRFTGHFFEDLENHKLEPFITELNKPLLIMHSPEDAYGSIENGLCIFEKANQPKSFISLKGIDHLMLNKADAIYVGNLIAAWFEKYI